MWLIFADLIWNILPDRNRSCPKDCNAMQKNKWKKKKKYDQNTVHWKASRISSNKHCIPAVSHICSLTTDPPTLTIFEPNSTPMVCELSSLSENFTTSPICYYNGFNFIVKAYFAVCQVLVRYNCFRSYYLHLLSMKWCSKQDLPLPALPIMRNLKR